jgi:AraC-like DNA-binding protein
VEERFEALQEPWTGFVVEFPTFPKQLIQGREETQRILFLCPRSEANPTELCLALFGSQILMRRLQAADGSDSVPTAGFIFVYAAETPDALSSVLAPYQDEVNAPVLVARRENVVRTAHYVTEHLGRAQAGLIRAEALPGGADVAGVAARVDPAFATLPGQTDLWREELPDITLQDDEGKVVHAAEMLQDYRAEYACRYVLAHYHENINRDKMAELVNLSPGYFSNLFRSEVGMSFSDYLIQVRVENAKCLLRRFDLSVEDISKKCGFNSLAHFSRTFKDRCGLSPLKYRKSPQTAH